MVHLSLLPLLYTIPFISIIADTDNFGALVTKEASYYPPPEYPGLSLPLLTTMQAAWSIVMIQTNQKIERMKYKTLTYKYKYKPSHFKPN